APPLFTADLRHAEPGSYDFGFIDTTKNTGDLVSLDVDSTQGFCRAYYDKTDGAKDNKRLSGYAFPCSANIPDIYLGFGTYIAKISGEIINLGPRSK
ncbi:MAG: hypothetical protein Q9187_008111, partial [Circinaria calcarea]